MMTPVKMSLAEIVCAKNHAGAVIDALYAAGAVEIEKSDRVTQDRISRFSFPEEDIREAEKLRALFAEITDADDGPGESRTVTGALEQARNPRADAESIIAVRRRIDALGGKISGDEIRERCLEWLASIGIDKRNCASSSRLLVVCGSAPPECACGGELCIRSDIGDGRSFILAAFPRDREEDARQLLGHESFRAIDLFAEPDTGARRLLEDVKRTFEGFCGRIREIREADAALAEYLRLAQFFSQSGETQRCAHILCWLPSDEEDKIRKALPDDICSLRMLPAETAIGESVFADEEVPSMLGASRIFAPFRLVLSVYGHPAYRSIDPTVPGAIFFLLFFGLMFADIGHGAVLAMIGMLLLIPKHETARNAGKLLIGAGSASALCGFLFGSFFGLEDIVPALLFHPAQHISPFLFTGLAVGVVVVSAGIVLNIAKSFIRREWAGAFFSQWGIITLGFYWLCAGIIAASFGNGAELPASFIIASAVMPLAAMTIGEIVNAKLTHEGEFSEIIFHPVEVLLGLLSNTVSFVRLAAFGLCHIALMSAVYIIASSGPDDPAYRISVSIEGNILVIGLELLVVTIQCLRLQFYEFFSKFFGAPGRKFSPLRAPHAREGA